MANFFLSCAHMSCDELRHEVYKIVPAAWAQISKSGNWEVVNANGNHRKPLGVGCDEITAWQKTLESLIN